MKERQVKSKIDWADSMMARLLGEFAADDDSSYPPSSKRNIFEMAT